LKDLHKRFPKLRIILEHCTTAAALDAVRNCGPSVEGSFWLLPLMANRIADSQGAIATITAHYLYLTEEISQRDPLAFCKPIPKKASDRDTLIKAACSGDPKFILWVVNACD
jgi:dihydroorotase